MTNQTEEIRQYIMKKLSKAKINGDITKDIRAGDIMKEMQLGHIPRSVCDAMRSIPCFSKYKVVITPPKGNSTTLVHRYYLDESDLDDNVSIKNRGKVL